MVSFTGCFRISGAPPCGRPCCGSPPPGCSRCIFCLNSPMLRIVRNLESYASSVQFYAELAPALWRAPPPCYRGEFDEEGQPSKELTGLAVPVIGSTNALNEAFRLAFRNGAILLDGGEDAARRTFGCLYGIQKYGGTSAPFVPGLVQRRFRNTEASVGAVHLPVRPRPAQYAEDEVTPPNDCDHPVRGRNRSNTSVAIGVQSRLGLLRPLRISTKFVPLMISPVSRGGQLPTFSRRETYRSRPQGSMRIAGREHKTSMHSPAKPRVFACPLTKAPSHIIAMQPRGAPAIR